MLDTTTAKATLRSLLTNMAARTDDPEQAREDYADLLIDIVADLIRTGTVSGQVTTTGTATAQTGTITTSHIS